LAIFSHRNRLMATLISRKPKKCKSIVQEILDDKINEITRQWEATYGPFGPQMWERIL